MLIASFWKGWQFKRWCHHRKATNYQFGHNIHNWK